MNHVAGMDLGSAHDYTTLAIIENLDMPRLEPWQGRPEWAPRRRLKKRLVHLKRWPLELPYTLAIEQAAEILRRPPFSGTTTLVYDRTGLGSAVAWQFKDARREGLFDRSPKGLAITGGEHAGASSVPKVELVDNLRALVETQRITWPPDLPLLDEFLREMSAFAPRPSRERRILTFGNDSKIADHDDLVMAVALAAWHPGRRPDNRYLARDGAVYAGRDASPDPY